MISNSKTGFTLIELLVVIGVIAAIGVITSSTIQISLRGAGKVNTIASAKQNGNYAIGEMAKMLRYVKSLDRLSGQPISSTNNCVVGTPVAPTPTQTPIQYSSVSVTLFDGTKTTVACDGTGKTITSTSTPPNSTAPTPTPASLLDSSVSVATGTCYFTCYQEYATDPPKIGIQFTLTQSGTTTFLEKKTTLPFEASIVLRNAVK